MFLEVRDLNKTYRSGRVEFQALHDINVTFEKGEFTAIAGPSGSGKTTLLNCVGCIDRADSGSILLEGEDLVERKPKELALLRREKFGFIFQTYNLIPVLSVFENVELPLKILRRYTDPYIREQVMGILKQVGLEGLEKRMPLELSGGQQQRVSIARALVKRPRIIFADEPTANLDSKTGESVVDLMKELNEKEGATFIFSTHDKLVMNRARRLITLRDGRIGQGGAQ